MHPPGQFLGIAQAVQRAHVVDDGLLLVRIVIDVHGGEVSTVQRAMPRVRFDRNRKVAEPQVGKPRLVERLPFDETGVAFSGFNVG